MMRSSSAGISGCRRAGGRGRAIENGIEDKSGGVAAEGQRSRSHFVEHGAEGEQIRAGVEFLAANLFGRHVGHGAESGAGTGEMVGIDAEGGERSGGGFGLRARVRDLGEAEVEDFGVAALGDEEVGGLDVAVNDAFGVSGIERVGNFDGEVEEAVKLHGTAGDEVLQSLTLQAFHGDKSPAVFFADVVDGADVGMVESGGGFGFAAKAAERLGIFGEIVGEKFQSYEAVEARVLGFVDDSHASAAEHLEHAVVREGLSDE